jgi:hypothetical protein
LNNDALPNHHQLPPINLDFYHRYIRWNLIAFNIAKESIKVNLKPVHNPGELLNPDITLAA